MKLVAILEAEFVDFNRLDDREDADRQPDEQPTDDQQDGDENSPDPQSDQFNQDEPGGETQPDNKSKEDPDRQGSIRTIPDAHLVYKRKNDHNLYDELWIYKQNQHDSWTMKTYDAIIAGSDIPKGSTSSPDSQQTVERWEVGDPTNTLVFVHIKGLPN